MDRYFDDFEIGERFRSNGATMTEADIIEFALAYDPQPFHIDTEAAAKSPYGGLGPVSTYLIDALLPQMGPGKARGAQFGHSKSATSNTAWPHLGRNPKGRGRFCAIRRCNSLMWNDHIAFAAPCLASKRPPSRRPNMC